MRAFCKASVTKHLKFHLILFSSSPSGDSIGIFIWEKLLSTEAIETGIVTQTTASLCKLGNNVFNISLVIRSLSCEAVCHPSHDHVI